MQAEVPQILQAFVQGDDLLNEAEEVRQSLMQQHREVLNAFNSQLIDTIHNGGLSRQLGVTGGVEAFGTVQAVAFVGYTVGDNHIPSKEMRLLRKAAFQRIDQSQTDRSRQLTRRISNRTVAQALSIGRAFREAAQTRDTAQGIDPREEVETTDVEQMWTQIDEIYARHPLPPIPNPGTANGVESEEPPRVEALNAAFDRSLVFRSLMTAPLPKSDMEFDRLINHRMERVLRINRRQDSLKFLAEKIEPIITPQEFINVFENGVSYEERRRVLVSAYIVGFDIGDISAVYQIADIVARRVLEYYGATSKSSARQSILMTRLIKIANKGAQDRVKYDKSLKLHSPKNQKIWWDFVETLDIDGEDQT